MNTKQELLAVSNRILWLEKAMSEDYAQYRREITNRSILNSLREIENDEKRHINMAERIIVILEK